MVYVILCFHVVDNLLLIILVYHMHDLEFNNMFKIEFDYSDMKLGFMRDECFQLKFRAF